MSDLSNDVTADGHPLRVLELFSGIGGMHWAMEAVQKYHRDEHGATKRRLFEVVAADINTSANVVCKHNFPSTLNLFIDDSTAPHLFEVVAAVDINTSANVVYKHNFPSTRLLQRNILSLSAEEINRMKINLITMSPPCQPHTRLGLKKDLSDSRSSPLSHLVSLLPDLDPDHFRAIFVENVKGFESSSARDELVNVLRDKCQFNIREFLLSPHQFDIPNSRLRYFMIATRRLITIPLKQMTTNFHSDVCCEYDRCDDVSKATLRRLWTHMASALRDVADDADGDDDVQTTEAERVQCTCTMECRTKLESFVETEGHDHTPLLLPDKLLLRYGTLLDIVSGSSTGSCCFTKGYGHLVEGSGSVLQMTTDLNADEVFRMASKIGDDEQKRSLLHQSETTDAQEKLNLLRHSDNPSELTDNQQKIDLLHRSENISEITIDQQKLNLLRQLRLRYFSPREMCRLMMFPQRFTFPDGMSDRQKFKLIGNSVNVYVVSILLHFLLRRIDKC